jgi:hypothetical protein
MVVCVSGGCAARLRSSVVPTPSRINRGTHGDASRPSRGRARSLRAAASAVVTTDSETASTSAWLHPLRNAVFREGGTLKCEPNARPDSSRGVKAVKPYWRHGDASSYDSLGDVAADVAKAVAGAKTSRASNQNTHHHLRQLRHRDRNDNITLNEDDMSATPSTARNAHTSISNNPKP